jgi:hypothetical protein
MEFAPNGKPKYQRIVLGADVCKLLKEIYFADIKWQKCYWAVGEKYTLLKKRARIAFADKTEPQVIDEIRTWTKQDIEDAM